MTAAARPDAEGIPHLGDTARTAAGSGHDAVIDSGEIDGMSHGLLLAVRTKLGGSLELDPADLATDAMGERAGRFYGVEMVPLGTGRVRLAVVGQHPDPEA